MAEDWKEILLESHNGLLLPKIFINLTNTQKLKKTVIEIPHVRMLQFFSISDKKSTKKPVLKDTMAEIVKTWLCCFNIQIWLLLIPCAA